MNTKQVQPTLQGGVLIIGSLFWEDETNCIPGQEAKGRMRKFWRDNFLQVDKAASVILPTRYGRLSGKDSRKETYTIVLSKEYMGKNGTGRGLAVPFPETAIDYAYFRKQAIELARAEGIFCEGEAETLGAEFSRIAIWINNDSIYRGQIKQWWEMLRADTELLCQKNAGHYTWKDGTLLNDDFQISLELKDCRLDFTFCTYMKPRYKIKQKGKNVIMEYPTPEEIANAMIGNKYETYFRENIKNGITTADDTSIELLLKQRNPISSSSDTSA